MVTQEQLKEGIARYADLELANKTAGLKKWIIPMAVPPLMVELTCFIQKHSDMLRRCGYMSEDGLIDVEKLTDDAKRVAMEKGKVTEHFPILGDITFSIDDIELLRKHINGV